MSDEQTGQPAQQSGPTPPPAWAPPTEPLAEPPTAPDVPTVPTPPAAPPSWGPPPGAAPPQGPPGTPPQSPFGGPQNGPPNGPPTGPPLGGGELGWAAPPPGSPAPGIPVPPPQPRRSNTGRTVAIIVGILVVVLLVPAAAAAFLLLGSSSSELELSIDTCDIASDGSLSATGTVANRSGATSVDIEVRFLDVDGGDLVDSDRLDIELPGEAAERWRGTGDAHDAVQQVTCEVVADD